MCDIWHIKFSAVRLEIRHIRPEFLWTNSMKDLKHHFGNFSLLLDKLIFLANLRVKQPKMHVEDPVDKIRGKTKKKTETDALDYMFDSWSGDNWMVSYKSGCVNFGMKLYLCVVFDWLSEDRQGAGLELLLLPALILLPGRLCGHFEVRKFRFS